MSERDADRWPAPWHNGEVAGETLLPLRGADGGARMPLWLRPVGPVALSDHAGRCFRPGLDFRIEDGAVVVPPGSPVPLVDPDWCRQPADRPTGYRLDHRLEPGEIRFGDACQWQERQLLASYRSDETPPADWRPGLGGPLPGLAARRARGDAIHLVALGDSITEGWNASGHCGVAPFQPPWIELLCTGLGERTRLTNLAVAGKDAAWGVGRAAEAAAARPDLLVIAFGMNDAVGMRPAPALLADLRAQMATVHAIAPACEILLVAPMLGNEAWVRMRNDLLEDYAAALRALAGAGQAVALADVTGLWRWLRRRKRDSDLTGNGVNHPNDFGHRLYAQCALAAIAGSRRP